MSRALSVHTAMRNCTIDEGGPFGFGNQVPISSHRKLLWSKAMVVNVAETPGRDSGRHGRERRAQANRCVKCRKGFGDVKTGGSPILRDQLGGCLRLPERHPAYRRREARPGFVRNVRTWPAMLREKTQAATTARSKVPMRWRGADCLVRATKRGNARGAKGAGHRHWVGSTSNGRSPIANGRRQPSCDGTSRINREVHVRNL